VTKGWSDAPLVCVAPHLDDGVLSCGEVLCRHAGSLLVTVFAGVPSDGDRLTAWDSSSGFTSAREAVMVRRNEDRAATAAVGAASVHLAFRDAQYDEPHPTRDVAAMLGPLLDTGRVLVPLGLFHEDHEQVHHACLRALRRRSTGRTALAFYEDSPYRAIDGGRLVEERVRALDAGLHRVEIHGRRSAVAKRSAVACYRSQLQALRSVNADAFADAQRPERYWVSDGDDSWL